MAKQPISTDSRGDHLKRDQYGDSIGIEFLFMKRGGGYVPVPWRSWIYGFGVFQTSIDHICILVKVRVPHCLGRISKKSLYIKTPNK